MDQLRAYYGVQRVRQLAVQPCLHGHLHVWFHFKRGLKPHTRAAAANLKKTYFPEQAQAALGRFYLK